MNPRHNMSPKFSQASISLSSILPKKVLKSARVRPVAGTVHRSPVLFTGWFLASSSIFHHFHTPSHFTSFIKHPPYTLYYIPNHFSLPFSHIYSPSHGFHQQLQVLEGLEQEEARRRLRSTRRGLATTWWQQGPAGLPSWASLHLILLSFCLWVRYIWEHDVICDVLWVVLEDWGLGLCALAQWKWIDWFIYLCLRFWYGYVHCPLLLCVRCMSRNFITSKSMCLIYFGRDCELDNLILSRQLAMDVMSLSCLNP